ncbi:WhiB family transcriptional regulator [Micromonospora sp. WMMD1082]|uniref:WhiB family transcriptional regulator n=1 Tax=Micromonospora sp. WMMD1082 TaxID=3016104 RepID=UPI0024179957|nr:WhiB family transcriptional regulator [Micromonospora sp. WMMD1082]MDG4796193.1 WhiB family transcriptional regulator [Micromonospora sp. WMMD1082]
MSAHAPAIWGNPATWLHQAETRGITPACRGASDHLFFPEQGTPRLHARITAAKAICGRCPLLKQCREWAQQQPPTQLYGVWGGTSRGDRLRSDTTHRRPQPEQFRRANERKAREKKEKRAA